MIRTIRVEEITKNIKEMCIEANHFLSPDMAEAMKCAEKNDAARAGGALLYSWKERCGVHTLPPCGRGSVPK